MCRMCAPPTHCLYFHRSEIISVLTTGLPLVDTVSGSKMLNRSGHCNYLLSCAGLGTRWHTVTMVSVYLALFVNILINVIFLVEVNVILIIHNFYNFLN